MMVLDAAEDVAIDAETAHQAVQPENFGLRLVVFGSQLELTHQRVSPMGPTKQDRLAFLAGERGGQEQVRVLSWRWI